MCFVPAAVYTVEALLEIIKHIFCIFLHFLLPKTDHTNEWGGVATVKIVNIPYVL